MPGGYRSCNPSTDGHWGITAELSQFCGFSFCPSFFCPGLLRLCFLLLGGALPRNIPLGVRALGGGCLPKVPPGARFRFLPAADRPLIQVLARKPRMPAVSSPRARRLDPAARGQPVLMPQLPPRRPGGATSGWCVGTDAPSRGPGQPTY